MARKAPVLDGKKQAVDDLAVGDGKTSLEGDPSAVFHVDEEACRERAYEISQSEHRGTPEENWLRAEAELRETPTA